MGKNTFSVFPFPKPNIIIQAFEILCLFSHGNKLYKATFFFANSAIIFNLK